MTQTTFATLPHHALAESTSNPRKQFEPIALQELADSIAQSGIHQALLVRPLPGDRLADTYYVPKGQPKPTHEIVAGHRRYRAAALAGLKELPCMIRHMTDLEVIEAQLVENLQRADLTAIDEAQGFDDWLQLTGHSTADLAAKVGKSKSYVQHRVQLLKLQPETKQALQAGQIDVSRALMLAPIPDAKLQLKALAYAANKGDGGNGTVPSVRELGIWLRQNVMLPLDRAPFQITDANLVPLAGSCKSCPKRTGAAPDIFSHVDGADICTDPPCYNNKAAEHIANLEFEAKRKGMRLVHGSEAKAICYEKSSTLNGYSPLSQVRNDLAAPYTGKRLDHLLSPSPAVPIAGAVLIENPYTRELIPAIPTAAAEAALIAKGLVKVMDQAAPQIKADKVKSKKDVEADIARLQADAAERVTERYDELRMAAVLADIKTVPDTLASRLMSPGLLRAHFGYELKYAAGAEALLSLDLPEDATADELTDAQIYKVAAVYMALDNDTASDQLAIHIGVDRSMLKHQAAAEVKAEVAAEIAALKATQKPPTPKSPLAQPPATPAADAKPKTPKAKGKLNAEDAQLGIAEAMQGIEAPPADGAVPVLKAVTGFSKGQQVKVTTVSTKGDVWRQKYEGKTGKVDGKTGEGWYVVTFKGRTGGVAGFTADELEAVAA